MDPVLNHTGDDELPRVFHSIGRCCEITYRTPTQVRAAAHKLGIKPALVINDVAHYTDDALARMLAVFQCEDMEQR